MLLNLIYYFIIIVVLSGCSSKQQKASDTVINEPNVYEQDEPKTQNAQANQFSDQQLNFEIKKMLSEINYLKEQFNDLNVKSSLYADPFSVYNKEIILNNGSSIFCKIISQDDKEIFVETLIGNLTIQRVNVVRIVENIIALEEDGGQPQAVIEIANDDEAKIISDAELINKRKTQSSASIILMGDITETKDKSSNTIFEGKLKNVGTERGDLVRIDFILRKNFQGDVERFTAYVNGSTHVFNGSGIISNSSIKPGALGEFKIIIPNAVGNFIGYSYEIHWDHYE